eukprot:1157476-Pelagomonas_calceolata.AAC.4
MQQEECWRLAFLFISVLSKPLFCCLQQIHYCQVGLATVNGQQFCSQGILCNHFTYALFSPPVQIRPFIEDMEVRHVCIGEAFNL